MKHPADKYGIDFEAIDDMEILTPGPVNGYMVTPEIIEEVAASYDTAILEAPLVIDHKSEGPAFGRVLELRVEDSGGGEGNQKLIAKVGLLIDGLAAIRSGQYSERSVLLLDFHPLEGAWYLNHLSLLGAANPAVVGLDPINLADLTEDDINRADFSEVGKNFARVCGERMHTWKKGDKFVEFRLRPAYRFENLTEKQVHRNKGIWARQGKLLPKYAGTDGDKILNQAILFETAKWDIPSAKSWLGTQKLSFDILTVPERIAAAFENAGDVIIGESIVAVWEETDEYIRHRVRDPEDFQEDTFKIVDISADQGIRSVMGKLKPEKVPEGNDADSMVVQNIMFDKSKDWTMEKAKEWVKDHPDFKGSLDTNKNENEKLTANAEGGNFMPDDNITTVVNQTPERVLIERDSLPDLEAQNAALAARVVENTDAALIAERKRNEELKAKNLAARQTIIKGKVDNLQTMGYIAPAQREMGLVDLIACIPEDATVNDRPAADVLLDILKFGGALKLKGEIAKSKEAGKASEHPDIDRLESSGVKIRGTETARRARELQKSGINPLEALRKARVEMGGR